LLYLSIYTVAHRLGLLAYLRTEGQCLDGYTAVMVIVYVSGHRLMSPPPLREHASAAVADAVIAMTFFHRERKLCIKLYLSVCLSVAHIGNFAVNRHWQCR